MNLIFFGSGEFGLPTLSGLARSHTIRAIVTQPDRPAGRGGAPTGTPIGMWAAAHLPGTRIIKPERVSDAGVIEEIRAAAGAPGDAVFVVIAFGQKLPPPLLEGVFAINLHASLLPRWRGAAPINWAILAGDVRTGNSVITLSDRMDAGQVLGRTARTIDPSRTAGELHDQLGADGPALVERVLGEHGAGSLKGEVQDEGLVTLAKKLTKADGWVDFSDTGEACRRRVHGLTPWPGVTVMLQGAPLKLLRVEPIGGVSEREPFGRLLDAGAGVVGCGGGTALRLLEVQAAGKRAMTWQEFVRGRRLDDGEEILGKSSC
jgi:methionyl-tRNA formyltransferase